MIAALVTLSAITLGSLIYYVNMKIKPEALKAGVSKYVKSNYPALGLKLGSLEVGLGLVTSIKIKNINLVDSEKGKLLAFEEALIKVPLFNIITGGGTIEVKVKSPEVKIIKVGGTSNWELAFKKDEKKSKKKKVKSKLPLFLVNSQINAEFANLQVSYIDKKKGEKKAVFRLLQLKDIGIKRPMAFKLISSIKLGADENMSIELNSIGEFGLKSFVKDKVIKAKALVRLNNIVFKKRPLIIEEVVVNANILFRKDKTGKIELALKSDGFLDGDIRVLILKEGINFEIEKLKLQLESAARTYGVSIEDLDLNNSSLDISGGLEISEKGFLTPDLGLKVSAPVLLSALGQNVSIDRLSALWKGDDIDVSTSMRVLKGRVDIKGSNQISINGPIDFSKLGPTNITMVINGAEIPKSMLLQKRETSQTKKKKSKPFLVPIKLNLDLKNILLGTEAINGSGEITVVKNKFAVKGLVIKHKGGQLDLNMSGENLMGETDYSFNLEAESLNADLISVFLEKDSPQISGTINSSIVGKAKGSGAWFDVFIKGDAVNGELKNYDISSIVNDQLKRLNGIPYLKKKIMKEVHIPQDYKRITFDIHAKSNKILIKKGAFLGLNNKVEVKASGFIRPEGASEIFVNVLDTKGNYLKFLKKNFDINNLPIKMSGQGYELKNDYDYTTQILLGSLKKKHKLKVKKKVMKKAKEMLKGLL